MTQLHTSRSKITNLYGHIPIEDLRSFGLNVGPVNPVRAILRQTHYSTFVGLCMGQLGRPMRSPI